MSADGHVVLVAYLVDQRADRRRVDVVADRCGFGSGETMRRAFLRVLGVGPGEYRRRFASADPVALAGAS